MEGGTVVRTSTMPHPVRPSSVSVNASSDAAGRRSIEVFVATLLSVAVMIRVPVYGGLTVGDFVAILFVPVWFTAVARFRFAPVLLAVVAAAAVSGATISLLEVSRSVNSSLLIANTGYLVGIIVSVGALLWARSVIGTTRVALLAAIGLLARIPLLWDPASTNIWKFVLEVPVMVLVLAFAAWTGKRWIEIVALVCLGAIDLVADSRSATAMVMMTLALVAWQSRPTGRTRRGSTIRTLLGFAVLGSVVYLAVTALIFGGALGQDALERSEAQIETSGSLITGGRPEIGASTSLIADQPLGYGSGTIPTAGDVLVAKSGMAALGYDPNNGYVEKYLFGSGFEVHSIIGDLWVRYGLLGLAFAIGLLLVAIIASGARVASRTATALLVFLSIRLLWESAFGPIYTMLPIIIIFLVVALPERHRSPTSLVDPARHLQRFRA
jgi:hypothetical protein